MKVGDWLNSINNNRPVQLLYDVSFISLTFFLGDMQGIQGITEQNNRECRTLSERQRCRQTLHHLVDDNMIGIGIINQSLSY